MPDDRPVNPVTPADLDTLSAYLDNQLAPADRAALEARLAAEPNLRAELDALRALQAALAGLSSLRAPRNLTLTPAQARPVRRVSAFPAFVSGLSAIAAAILLVAGFIALRPVSAPSFNNAVAAAPTATATEAPLTSPAARELSATLPLPEQPRVDTVPSQESASDVAGFGEGGATAQELFAATDMAEPGLMDAALAAPPAALESQQGAAADSMMAGAAPVTGNSAEAMPTGGSELAMQAPAPQATQPVDGARTKESTPTAVPSDTPVPTITASATSAPTVSAPTAAPTPVPAAAEQVPAEPTPPAAGWLLLGLGGVMLVVALFAARRARRPQ